GAEVEEGLAILGVECRRTREDGRALRPFALGGEREAEIVQERNLMRTQAQTRPGDRLGLCEALLVSKYGPEIVVSQDRLRLELDRLGVGLDRLVQFPLRAERIAEIAVGLGKVRCQPNRLAIASFRLLELAPIVMGDA